MAIATNNIVLTQTGSGVLGVGDGTQAIFEDSPEVLFVSSHQMPLYPGSGSVSETGVGNVVNLPLAPGDGSDAFRAAWSRRGLPMERRGS